MKRFSIILLTLITLVSSSCRKVNGDGPVVTETRQVSHFNGVDLRCSAEVLYQQGNDYNVEVSAQRNILDVLEIYTSNNRLVVRFKDDVRVRSHEKVRIEVTAPSAEYFRVSGSGSIRTAGLLAPPRVDMDVSGSGSITISQFITQSIDATISGSGSISVLNGEANEVHTRISGSGDLDLLNVPIEYATTTTSGSGITQLNVSKELNVTISGSGSVFYLGNPTIHTRISGSGRVIPK